MFSAKVVSRSPPRRRPWRLPGAGDHPLEELAALLALHSTPRPASLPDRLLPPSGNACPNPKREGREIGADAAAAAAAMELSPLQNAAQVHICIEPQRFFHESEQHSISN
jgi:hypothetical protein